MKSNHDDYLKYWRVIRQFVKIKYGLTQSDLDIIFFLYSEKYFDKDKFTEFDNLLGWDKQRFEKLRQAGWIESFRHGMTPGGRRAIYKLSSKATSMVRSIYKKLNGEEIPVFGNRNPVYENPTSDNQR